MKKFNMSLDANSPMKVPLYSINIGVDASDRTLYLAGRYNNAFDLLPDDVKTELRTLIDEVNFVATKAINESELTAGGSAAGVGVGAKGGKVGAYLREIGAQTEEVH